MAKGGDSETGGGGSVRWKVNEGDIKTGATPSDRDSGSAGNGWHQRGRDNDGEAGTDFTVSIRAPNNMPADVFLGHLRAALAPDPNPDVGSARVYFNLPIERNVEDQIRIIWGAGHPKHRGNGGIKPTKFPTV